MQTVLRCREWEWFPVPRGKGLSKATPHETLDGMEYAIKEVRQDRRPLDMTAFKHRVTNDW